MNCYQDGENCEKESENIFEDESQNVDKKSELCRTVTNPQKNSDPRKKDRPGSEVESSFEIRWNGYEDDDRSGQQDLSNGSNVRSEYISVDENEFFSESDRVEDDLKEHREVEDERQPLKNDWRKWTNKNNNKTLTNQ